jgi:nicotinamidase/pyrazinamidase
MARSRAAEQRQRGDPRGAEPGEDRGHHPQGFHPAIDSYSTFFENDQATTTGLDGWLRARGFRRIFLAGLATDFCVAWSAEDAVRLGYTVFVVEDACRGIGLPADQGGTTIDAARVRLHELGVRFIGSGEMAGET